MTNHANLLPEYVRLREIGTGLNNKLVASLSTEVLREGGRKLGILRGDTFVFGSEDESSVLMDFCIHNVYRGGQSAVQRYLAESPPSDRDEMELLEAKQRAHYSILRVADVERGVGVSVFDVLREETGFLFDVGFGNSAEEGMLFAGRVVPWREFLMTGGASLPLIGESAIRVKDCLERHDPGTYFGRLAPEQEADLAAMIIRACLNSGASSQIIYETPGQSTSYRQCQLVRANRNDPCPCGSGRKYKSCCGRRPARTAGPR